MKQKINILLAVLGMVVLFGTASCSDDDFTESIFDTTDYPLDKNSYSFPLDTFVKKNFLEPYNMRYMYRMQDIGSDMEYNLVPCTYDKALDLAVLSKYLWYDVYSQYAGETFLKTYSPRIIHVIGSPAYNPTSGTETLGYAEGGLKITLYNANNLDPNDMDNLNEKFFKTMHHEFSHILHQNINMPNDFPFISNGRYNQSSWQDTPDSVALGQGFISPYASSAYREDWVEIMANYIVKDEITWNDMLKAADYDWETVDDYPAKDFDKAVARGADRDTLGYFVKVTSYEGGSPSTYKIQRKLVSRSSDGTAVLNEDGTPQFENSDGQVGRQIILQKLQMATEWIKKNFGYDLQDIRDEVQRRQWVTDADGNFVKGSNGRYINNLTYVRPDGTTLLDELRQEVLKYKELQNK